MVGEQDRGMRVSRREESWHVPRTKIRNESRGRQAPMVNYWSKKLEPKHFGTNRARPLLTKAEKTRYPNKPVHF